jgi:hypothetical protein
LLLAKSSKKVSEALDFNSVADPKIRLWTDSLPTDFRRIGFLKSIPVLCQNHSTLLPHWRNILTVSSLYFLKWRL